MPVLSFHPDGYFTFFFKQLTTTIPQILTDVDLSGQTVLITGANSGVGFQTARLYVKHKARVIFGVRNMQKGETAAEKIREEFESAEIKVMEVDMESFDTIKSFVGELERSEPRVDIAVLNAGIWRYRASISPTGYDVHLQVRSSCRNIPHITSYRLDILSIRRIPSDRCSSPSSSSQLSAGPET